MSTFLATTSSPAPRRQTRRHVAGALAISLPLLAAAVALAVVTLRGPAPPRTIADRVQAIGSTLRCPVCRDLSVADSPSTVAREMRVQIGNELRAGKSPARIKEGFVSAYGDSILLAPPRSGLNLVVWMGPFVLLAVGLLLGLVSVGRWVRRGAATPPEAPGVSEAPPESAASSVTERERWLLEAELDRMGDEVE